MPLYNWKSIFSTNYDNLVEQVYEERGRSLRVYDSNFCFTTEDEDTDCNLFKLHGTIEKDICDGDNSQIILTEEDYEQTEDYREYLYDRLKSDLAGADLIIIGHSLADPDIKAIVNRAVALNANIHSPSKITLLMYTLDENRASLFERKGLQVCFGDVDQFCAKLATANVTSNNANIEANSSFDQYPVLVSATTEVAHAVDQSPNISLMFNGKPATYADIKEGFTFERSLAQKIVSYFEQDKSLCATLLGASGVGKTTSAKQALLLMLESEILCWQHKSEQRLSVDLWHKLAGDLKDAGAVGVLFVDDAHHHIYELNDLIDSLVLSDNAHLKILIVSTRNHWFPRIKTPNIFKFGKSFSLSQLEKNEIERLLVLLDESPKVRELVEGQFSGFNRQERRRRLAVRCEADMFVCLKNIFANDSFDNIVLQEFAELEPSLQEVYRYVAAMETAGIQVHRQLIIRLLGIPALQIDAMLQNLTDIIGEYTINERQGIYGWRCRHSVISAIITKYKFQNQEKLIALFDDVIDNISPTYDIEIRSLRQLCNIDTGISRIPDKDEQNRLLRKMMSNAPGERVPRHRLIRNLIDQCTFEKAETEIRLFEKDFGVDGPVYRYKIKLMTERAIRTPSILEEDRIAILEQAYELAVRGAARYKNNKNVLSCFAELGIEYYKKTGHHNYYDEAIKSLQAAEERLGDPHISNIISGFNRRIAGHIIPEKNNENDTQ
ncbi:MAG: SIR2 family protein [Rhodobacteraceae bacterium]|nr:SIR2 family protein [Paracoccaceae bacterium]